MSFGEELTNYFETEILDNYDNHSIDSNETGHSEDPEFMVIKTVVDFADYILFGLSFPALFINAFVFGSSLKLYRTSEDPTHMLVGSMTFADLLICLTHQLRIIVQRLLCSAENNLVLLVHMALAWTGYSTSGISLILLNVEKLLYFHWPLHYELVVTFKKTLVAIIVSWLVCILYTVLLLTTAYWCEEGNCIVPRHEVYQYYIIVFSIVPVVSSGILSVYLWCTVQSKRQVEHGRVSFSQQVRTMLFIFITSGWAVVSLLLARLYYIFFLENTNTVISWIGFVTNYLLLLYPVVNPLLTILVYPCYRNIITNLFKCSKAKLNKIYETVRVDETLDNGHLSMTDNSLVINNGLYTVISTSDFN